MLAAIGKVPSFRYIDAARAFLRWMEAPRAVDWNVEQQLYGRSSNGDVHRASCAGCSDGPDTGWRYRGASVVQEGRAGWSLQ
jgi:hypothetical protein